MGHSPVGDAVSFHLQAFRREKAITAAIEAVSIKPRLTSSTSLPNGSFTASQRNMYLRGALGDVAS